MTEEEARQDKYEYRQMCIDALPFTFGSWTVDRCPRLIPKEKNNETRTNSNNTNRR